MKYTHFSVIHIIVAVLLAVSCERKVFSNQIVITRSILGDPCYKIVLSVEQTCRHKRVVIRFDKVKLIVSRKIRWPNAIINKGFMKFQSDMGTCGEMTNDLAIHIKTS